MQSIYFVVNLYWTPFFVASAAFIITSGVLSLKYTHFLSYFFFWCDHSSAWQKWVFRYQHEFMYKVMAHNEAGRMLRDIASSNFDTNIDIRRFYLTICRRNKRIWWPRTFFRRFGADKAPHTHTHTCDGPKRNELLELWLVTVYFWFEPSSNLIPCKLKRHSAQKKRKEIREMNNGKQIHFLQACPLLIVKSLHRMVGACFGWIRCSYFHSHRSQANT